MLSVSHDFTSVVYPPPPAPHHLNAFLVLLYDLYMVLLFDNSIQKNQDPNRGLKNTSAGFNTELHVSQSIHLKYCNSHPSNLPKSVYYPTKLHNSRLYCLFCLLDVIPR